MTLYARWEEIPDLFSMFTTSSPSLGTVASTYAGKPVTAYLYPEGTQFQTTAGYSFWGVVGEFPLSSDEWLHRDNDSNVFEVTISHMNVSQEYLYVKIGSGAPTVPAQPQQPAVPTTPGAKTAIPTNDDFYVDGVLAVPAAYKIGGSNYFKIRDVAALVNGTDAQFSVDYDNATQSVIIVTGESYELKKGDLAGVSAGEREAIPSNNAIYVNGEKVELTVYKIGGGNYFKLRDLGKVLGFNVGYTAGYGAFIETSES